MLREQLNGIQHVGIPTNDIEATIEFYGKLGFEVALQTVNEEANEKVSFLKLNNLVIETYENKAAKMESGAIDHVAIDVKDIEKVYIRLLNQFAFCCYTSKKSIIFAGNRLLIKVFHVLKDNEIRQYGKHCTKYLVLEVWNKFGFDN